MRPLREAMKSARAGLRGVMDKSPLDEIALRKAAESVSAARTEMIVHMARTKAKVDAVLTAQQKATRADLRAEIKAKFKERREQGKQELTAWIDQNAK
jgi:Spy/CpxP family protein refolding chaperone